jgi:hypothetical protein
MGIQVTPIPRLTVLTAPAFTLGTANTAGSAVTAVASDSTLAAFDATVPTTIAYGASAAAGSVALASHRDHTHGMPAGLASVFDDVTVQQTINDSVAFQTTTLTYAVGANEDWAFQIYLLYNSGSTPDLKLEWSGIPSGGTGNWSGIGYTAGGAVDIQSHANLATDITAGGQGAVYAIVLYGVYIGAGASGTLQLDFAQNTANASNTTIEVGSWGIFTQIR